MEETELKLWHATLIIADKTTLSTILLSFFEKGDTQKKLKIRHKIVVMLG